MVLLFATATTVCGFILLVQISQATLTLEFDEDFRDCDNGLPMPGFDASELQVIPQDDGSVTMNGTIKFTKDYASPTRMKLHSKRLQQGEWKPGMFSREIRDLCPVMQMPTELWYPFTRILQQKTCPYRAGHEEHINNVNVENVAAKFNVPPDFLGEWRVYHEFTTTRQGSSVKECLMVPVTVFEV